jgi:hypothetical protein
VVADTEVESSNEEDSKEDTDDNTNGDVGRLERVPLPKSSSAL